MSNDDTRRFHRLRSALGTTRQLAGTWAKAKTHALQARLETPDSWIAGGGSEDRTRWQERHADRDQLNEYHTIRQDGGVVATLLEARALMVFGPGGQFTSEDDAVAEWLNDTLNDRDSLIFDLGCDAYFYGYALSEIRETRGGDFGEITPIQPWTTTPTLSAQGEIDQWEQEIETPGGRRSSQTFAPDDIQHFKVMKASARDPVGMSLLGRAMDEAQSYHDHQEAINNAIQLQGFPKFHVKLGREDGAVIDDNELRRARPKFDNIHELTKWVTGRDVDIDVIEAENFEFEGITEHDLSKLAIAFMLPIELTQIGGGDGLGTGFPAKLRRQLFLLGARAHQRLLGDQLVQQLGRPLLERYAPDEIAADAEDVPLEFTFNDPVTDIDELATQINAIGPDMTVDERRDLFDLSPLDDKSVGDDYEPPGRADQTPPPGAEDGFGGAQLQADSLSADVISWITEYAESDRGAVSNPISNYLAWVDDVSDTPTDAIQRSQTALTLFANSQGIQVADALEQPVENLLQYLQRERNLQAPSDTTLREELAAYRRGFETIVWGDRHDLSDPAFAQDEDVPANVQNRIERAADRIDWSDTDGAPPQNLRELFTDKLQQPRGWSINSLSRNIEDRFGIESDRAENVARTKSAQLLNEATDQAVDDLADGIDGEVRMAWVGPLDDDTTDPCTNLQEETDPDHGGTPLPRSEFEARKAELQQEFFPEFDGDEAIHWQERHRKEPFLPNGNGLEAVADAGTAGAAGDD